MDPNATLRDLRAALTEGDQDAARELAEALADWLKRGGFTPDGATRAEALKAILAAGYQV